MTTVVATTKPADSPAGELLAGRYRLLRLVGRGGMGRVWLAGDELLQRPVAVKQVIQRGPVGLAEARAAARVDHPGTVRVHDVVEHDGETWIVMEALSGTSLAQTLEDEGPLPVGEVARIAGCLLEALEAVHRAGLVHCDVKPANVQLCADGRVVLTDFGIAFAGGTHPGLSGSPAYIAPERARGGDIEPASDLFSLGATLFAAVEGRSPFGKADPFETLVAVIEDIPGPFANAGDLRPLLDGLLAKNPKTRLTIDQAKTVLAGVQTVPGGTLRS